MSTPNTLSPGDLGALEALRKAVAEALDRKRRLGQYAVIWKDGNVVRLNADGSETVTTERTPGS